MEPFALVAATTVELEPVRRALVEAELAPAVTRVTGMGQHHAAATVARLLTDHRGTFAWVLHVGFAGGLDPIHETGDVLRIGRVTNETGERLTLDDANGRAVLLTSNHVVGSVVEKERLFKTHLAGVVDMETFAVAKEAVAAGMPLIAIRAVSDPADFALPVASAGWVTPEGRPRAVAAALYALTHPWRIPHMLRLARDARVAGERLAAAAVEAVRDRG